MKKIVSRSPVSNFNQSIVEEVAFLAMLCKTYQKACSSKDEQYIGLFFLLAEKVRASFLEKQTIYCEKDLCFDCSAELKRIAKFELETLKKTVETAHAVSDAIRIHQGNNEKTLFYLKKAIFYSHQLLSRRFKELDARYKSFELLMLDEMACVKKTIRDSHYTRSG